MTFPIRFQVNAGNHFCFIIALGENDAHTLLILRHTFQRISGARPGFYIAFAVIDLSLLHDLLHLGLGNLAAFHPALSMLGIFNEGNPPVKAPVSIYFTRPLVFLTGFFFIATKAAAAHQEKNQG